MLKCTCRLRSTDKDRGRAMIQLVKRGGVERERVAERKRVKER